jgi:hypothetical protein
MLRVLATGMFFRAYDFFTAYLWALVLELVDFGTGHSNLNILTNHAGPRWSHGTRNWHPWFLLALRTG